MKYPTVNDIAGLAVIAVSPRCNLQMIEVGLASRGVKLSEKTAYQLTIKLETRGWIKRDDGGRSSHGVEWKAHRLTTAGFEALAAARRAIG
jgi:DNA-binding PadR family transcriptional regulator